jgi:hypothetical protein
MTGVAEGAVSLGVMPYPHLDDFQAQYGGCPAPPYRSPGRAAVDLGPSKQPWRSALEQVTEDPELLAPAIEGFAATELAAVVVPCVSKIWGERAGWLTRIRGEWVVVEALADGVPLEDLPEDCRRRHREELESCLLEASQLRERSPSWVQRYSKRLIPSIAGHIRRSSFPSSGSVDDGDSGKKLSSKELDQACRGEAESLLADLLTGRLPAMFDGSSVRPVPEGPPEWRFLAYLKIAARDQFKKSRLSRKADPTRERIAALKQAARDLVNGLCQEEVEWRTQTLVSAINSGKIPVPERAQQKWGKSRATLATLWIVLDRFGVERPSAPGDPSRRHSREAKERLPGAGTQRGAASYLGKSPETVNKYLGWAQHLQRVVEEFENTDEEWKKRQAAFVQATELVQGELAKIGRKIDQLQTVLGSAS